MYGFTTLYALNQIYYPQFNHKPINPMKQTTMQRTIYLVITLLLSTAIMQSCQTQAEQIPGYENISLNPDFLADVELIKAVSEAFFIGDAASMDRYLHESYVGSGPDFETITRQEEIDGWVEFAQHFENARLSDEIFHSVIVDAFEGNPEMPGKWVLMWANMHYSSTNDGREISFPLHVIFKIENNQLLYTGSYFDRLTMFRQMGYELARQDELAELE